MMKLLKTMLAVAVASLTSVGAQAQVPYTGNFYTGAAFDGWISGVTGMDIYSNGAAAFFCVGNAFTHAASCGGGAVAGGSQMNPAATTGLAGGDVIRTLYQGVVNVVNPGLSTPSLIYPGSTATLGYQLTVAAIIDEVVVGGTVISGVATALLQPLDGGKIGLFYDHTGPGGGTLITNAAAVAAGLGYTDGLLIAGGAISSALSLPTNVSANGTSMSGSANIGGLFSYVQEGDDTTNTVGFSPPPHDFESTTTLQYGPTIKGYQTANFFDNANGWSSVAVNAALTERADANVDLTAAAPEPSSLALVGLAIAGLGVFGYRRKA